MKRYRSATVILRVGDLTMDLATRDVRRGDRAIDLSPRETAFLEYFMRNAGLLLTRKMLEDALWERDRETASNVIDVYVRRLRRKLSEGGEPQLIATIRGVRIPAPPALMHVRSLRGKLRTLTHAAALFVALVLFAIGTVFTEHQLRRASFDDRIETATRALIAVTDARSGQLVVVGTDPVRFARIVGSRLNGAILGLATGPCCSPR